MADMNSSVLVLHQDYRPVNVTSVRRAMRLLYLGKVQVVRSDSRCLRTVDAVYEVPSVVRLTRSMKRPAPQLKLTRKGVLARDHHTCQYCGAQGGALTLDHVIPRDRGGEHDWENVVGCCLACNNRKGNQTPHEAGLRLLRQPRKPRYVPYFSFPKFMAALQRAEWREFLGPYAKSLEA